MVALVTAISIYAHTGHAAKGVSTVKQIGAYLNWNNALARSEEINKSGKHAYIMEKRIKNKTFFIVLEGARPMPAGDKLPTYKDMGYVQVGAFLGRHRAEDLIKALRAQGAITFHCMKKIDDKVYYRVYRKTGKVLVPPCTTVPGTMPPPPGATENSAPAAQEQAPMGNSPSAMAPVPDETEETAGTGQEITADEAAEAAMANAPAEEGITDEVAGSDMANTPEGDEYAALPEQDAGQTEASQNMAALLADTTPITSLEERPPLYEAPEIVVLDTSMVRKMDDNINFAVKPDAVVFADRNQFGTWYGTFKQFDGGKMVGQSNKWYALELINGKRGYVFKADTVEYNIPLPEDNDL